MDPGSVPQESSKWTQRHVEIERPDRYPTICHCSVPRDKKEMLFCNIVPEAKRRSRFPPTLFRIQFPYRSVRRQLNRCQIKLPRASKRHSATFSLANVFPLKDIGEARVVR